MVHDVERTARRAGMREPTDLEQVDRRRRQLLSVGVVVFVALAAVVVIRSFGAEGATGPFPQGLLEACLAALGVAFVLYAMEKERALRRLTYLLVEERLRREHLRRQVRRLDSLARAGKELSASLELDRVTDLALEHALHLVDAGSGAVFLAGRDRLTLRAARGAEVLELGEAVVDEVGAQRRLVTDGDGRRVGVPLIVDHHVAGVLVVATAADGGFETGDLELLAAFAAHAAAAIANCLAFAEERAASSRYERLEAVREEFAWLAR